MSRTKNKWSKIKRHKKNGLDRKLREVSETNKGVIIIRCNPDTPWKYGKPERSDQTDRLKGYKKSQNKRFRRFLERETNRKLKEEIDV